MDDIERGLIAAELHVAAHEVLAAIPHWYRDLSANHNNLVQVIRAAGDTSTAGEAERHGPCLDDGVVCTESGLPYPCTKIRFLAWDTSFTNQVAEVWDRDFPAWRKAVCGTTEPDQMWVDW